jgi:hypothetical protein
MGLAQYAAVIAHGKGWSVLHDGNVENEFAAKEAAFEAASLPQVSQFVKVMKSKSACLIALLVIRQF